MAYYRNRIPDGADQDRETAPPPPEPLQWLDMWEWDHQSVSECIAADEIRAAR